MAHATGSYGNSFHWSGTFNTQLKPMIEKNNALNYGLETAISWFNDVAKTWSIDSFEQGRLLYCGSNCGSHIIKDWL